MPRASSLLTLVVAALAGAVVSCGAPAKPVLEAVVPALLSTAGGTVEVHGTGLVPLAKLDFDKSSQSTVVTTFTVSLTGNGDDRPLTATWKDETKLSAVVPTGLPAGSYGVTVVDPRGQTATLASALTLVDCSIAGACLADGGVAP